MGFEDSQFFKLQNKLHLSDAKLYKLAGNSMNGRYVVAGGFESPEVYDGITLPVEEASDAVFRLHIAAPDAEEGTSIAVELPMTQESIDLFAQVHDGQPIGSFVIVNMESGIPQITGSQFGSMDNFVHLNDIAQAYSEMNVGERMTFKAALQAQGGLSGNLSDILETAESVREYELAAFVSDEAEFFKEYLAHSLPTDFDVRWLDTLAISTDSLHLLERLGATVTDYGILSAKGESLYKSIPFNAPDADEAETQEQTNDGEIPDESKSEDMSEDGAAIFDEEIPTEDGAEITDEDIPTEDSAEITDEDIPTEDSAEITDEEIPTEDSTEITDEEIPTEDSTEITDDEIPTEDGAELTDEEIPTEDSTEITDDEIPTEDSVEITDEEIPNEDGAEITDEEIPTEDSTEITDEYIPTEDGAEIADEEIPTEDSTEITDDEIPTEDSTEITDDEIPTEDGADITFADEGEFPFDEGEGACFPVEDDEIPSFCFEEDDQEDDESEDVDEDEDEDYEEYMGGMTL